MQRPLLRAIHRLDGGPTGLPRLSFCQRILEATRPQLQQLPVVELAVGVLPHAFGLLFQG